MFEFKFADIGEGIHEGTILKWNFKAGDQVKEGETLVVVETDKVNAELPSPVTGKIVSLGAKEGEVIHVGQTVVTIDDGTGALETPAVAPVQQQTAPQPQPVAKEVSASSEVYDFKFADIGEGIHEGTILKWNFKEGDKVNEGDTLVIVETDKVNAELPAPVSGTVLKIGKKEGEVIHVGETVVLLGEEGAAVAQAPAPKAEPAAEAKGGSVVGEIEVSDELIGGSTEQETVQSTGKVLASPVARKLASDLGVDIAAIKGTGEQGRVLKDDVQATKGQPQAAPVAQTATPAPQSAPVASQASAGKPAGDVEVVKISRLRKAISSAMVRAKSIIPHTVLMDEINVNALVDFRNEAKGVAESKGIKLTYMAFIAKAVVTALKEFPLFNASFNHDTDEVYIKKYINLGMAVDTPDGLIVPNIKNAENLSVFELASKIRQLADDTIARKISLDQQQNGTFTITNFGSVGIAYGTPVINYPELAIIGIGKIEKKPIVVGDEIKIASMLPLSLAVDHRIIDGADGGRFLLRVKELLMNPTLLLLS